MTERKKGLWIAFEGNDGSGKSTQLESYATYLACESGVDVVVTREPGGNPYSEKIRGLIFDKEVAGDGETQLLLFTAARRRNILTTVLPAINAGKIVLSDRSQGSTFAYQHCQFGIPWELVASINTFATQGVQPDYTFLLDVDVQVGLARMQQAKGIEANHFDNAAMEDLLKRKNGYLKLAGTLPNWIVVNANNDEVAVARDIIEETKNRILKSPSRE